MSEKFTVEKRGRTITFEDGKTYYAIDRSAYNGRDGRKYWLPVITVLRCEKQNREEEGVNFYLKSYENLISNEIPLGQLDDPNYYDPDDWKLIYAFSLEEAKALLLKRFGIDERYWFFKELFGDDI